MDELLNAQPDDLKITYNMGLTSAGDNVTFTEADLKILNDKTTDRKISVSLAMIIPLQLKLNDVADIDSTNSYQDDGYITIDDVQSLTKDESKEEELEDLLSFRDDWDDDDTAKWEKYADAVEIFALDYNINNGLLVNGADETLNGTTFTKGDGLPLEVVLRCINEDGSAQPLFTKYDDNGNIVRDANGDEVKTNEKPLKLGANTLSFTKNEIKEIMTKPPFIPKVMVKIPAQGQSEIISRDGEFSVTGTFRIKFDGSVPVTIYDKND